MGAPEYDALTAEMVEGRGAATAKNATSAIAPENERLQKGDIILDKKNIRLSQQAVSPEQVILDYGRMMVEAGIVEEGYIQGMIERNESFPVAVGCHVAIPHGTNEARRFIKRNGLVVMTCPDGIPWEDDVVRLVIGIAVKDCNDHIDVLGYISEACDSDEATDALVAGADVDTLYRKLNGLE